MVITNYNGSPYLYNKNIQNYYVLLRIITHYNPQVQTQSPYLEEKIFSKKYCAKIKACKTEIFSLNKK